MERVRLGERVSNICLGTMTFGIPENSTNPMHIPKDYPKRSSSYWWDSATPIEETYRAFNDLVRCGKQQYNLLCRHSEFDEFQVCINEGIGVIPWSPLKGGLLTGKFKRGEQLDTEKSRIGFVAKDSMAKDFALAWSQYSDNESYWNLIELLNQIAKNHGKTIPQVALRWLIQKNIVSSVIMGATSVEQLENNMVAGSGPTQANEKMSNKIMDKYVELGGNFLDTANVYSQGLSEKIIGNWLQGQNRDDIIVATKVRGYTGPKPNQSGLSRRHIMKSCEESLERLQTDYIDLYQPHLWDSATPIEETYKALNDLVRCGKVRYIGVSNVTGWQLQKIVGSMKNMGLDPQQYNLLCRHSEFEEFRVCVNEGIGVIPWSPLKGGVLTGKFKRGEKLDTEKSRIGFISKDESKAMQAAPAWSQYADKESYWKLIEYMDQIAKNHGKTIPQVALRWLIQKNIVSSVIIGATSVEQLENNMGAGSGWSITLDEDQHNPMRRCLTK
ncbi:hypothetical protein KUTeg_012759 [Tegillarca granosa]|uniref:NADP-dependent oxidoreductase domain-containing protein n=1 Tax=Tegillarca granosa TaxID=220873 RepID=A0ABQ9F0F9_TEGGR|nr:hypothetical protein KUTeg_012759 [Tegillarca granosa]